jgi:hypothetical protein
MHVPRWKTLATSQVGQEFLDRLHLGLQLGQVGLEFRLALRLGLVAAVKLATVVAGTFTALSA